MAEWRTVVDHPDYEIDETGTVRRIASFPVHLVGRTMSTWTDEDGYLRINLRKDGIRNNFFIHKLVALAFIGPCPAAGYEVAHNDGSKDNNNFLNLRWATRSENENDKLLHGTHNRGQRHGRAQITDEQAKEIVALLETQAFSKRSIARQYGVSHYLVADIARGKSWKHLREAA